MTNLGLLTLVASRSFQFRQINEDTKEIFQLAKMPGLRMCLNSSCPGKMPGLPMTNLGLLTLMGSRSFQLRQIDEDTKEIFQLGKMPGLWMHLDLSYY
jgi:hypothetical protein